MQWLVRLGAELDVAIDCDDSMNITRRTPRIASTIVAGLSLAALGGGIASAASAPDAPTGTYDGSVIPVTITEPSTPFTTFFNGAVDCRNQGDLEHPYLVLDEDTHGHNEHRFGRSATYHTGDHRPLRILEHVWPGSERFDDGGFFHGERFFHGAGFFTKLTGIDGHDSVTVYCAASPMVAHQK
ncbi:hypothetical protein LQL77_31045 [Rhodococcus cerastii]|nr:hypothetical protein [Rhodococcus cerastii]